MATSDFMNQLVSSAWTVALAAAACSLIPGCAAPEARTGSRGPTMSVGSSPEPTEEPGALLPADAPDADRDKVVAQIHRKMAESAEAVNEFDEMVLSTDMAGRRLGAFLAAVEKREAKWRVWVESEEAKRCAELREQLGEARKSNDMKKAQDLDDELRLLQEAERRFRTQIRAEVVRVMTLDQQRDWATYVLWGRWGQFCARFSALQLSDEQAQKIMKLIRNEMTKVVRPGTAEADPYLWVVRRRDNAELRDRLAQKIAAEVLTAEQREQMTKR